MGAERLKALRHQRDLLIEHLDWINAEIDRETVVSNFPPPSPRQSQLRDAFAPNRPVEIALDRDPEELTPEEAAADVYIELGADARGAASEAKRGCLVVSSLGFAGLAMLFGYVIWWY